MQACASEFIAFLTSVMSGIVIEQEKRTMQVADLREALIRTGLDNMLPLLEEYQKKYGAAKEIRKRRIKIKKSRPNQVASGMMVDPPSSMSATSGSQSPIINLLKRDRQRLNLC